MEKLYRTNADAGLLLVRIAIGIVFLYHGIDKLTNLDGVIGFFGMLGLAPFVAYAVAIVETLGGLAMIVGYGARVAGLFLAGVMVGAIFLVKASKGFAGGGYELDLVMLLISLSITVAGPGRYSLSSCCKKDGSELPMQTPAKVTA